MPRIRKATDADRDVIAAIHLASWQDAYSGTLSDHLLHDLLPQEMDAMWAGRDLEGRDVAFVAEEEDAEPAVLGFVFVRTDVEPPLVDNLHIRPGLRSKGTGSALLSAAFQELVALGYLTATLDVLRDNRRARAFYDRTGGREIGNFEAVLHGETVAEVRVVFELT